MAKRKLRIHGIKSHKEGLRKRQSPHAGQTTTEKKRRTATNRQKLKTLHQTNPDVKNSLTPLLKLETLVALQIEFGSEFQKSTILLK